MPASPRATSVPLVPPDAPASKPSITAHSRSRPSNRTAIERMVTGGARNRTGDFTDASRPARERW
jgi:hypothetical protein